MKRKDPLKPLDPHQMPWYYYLVAAILLLLITFVGLYLAGEVDNPLDFLLNLKRRQLP